MGARTKLIRVPSISVSCCRHCPSDIHSGIISRLQCKLPSVLIKHCDYKWFMASSLRPKIAADSLRKTQNRRYNVPLKAKCTALSTREFMYDCCNSLSVGSKPN